MADTYKFTGANGVELTFVGERPPTTEEMKQLGASRYSNERERPSDSTSLAMATGAAVTPAIANTAMELATNPGVPRAAASAGRVVGGLAPTIGGAIEGGPVGALAGVAAASKGAWAGAKTGWFTGKLLQNMTTPVAKALEAVMPYLQTVSTLSGAQGVLDLAQIAEPKRQDIGVMGIGASTPHDDAHPALLNLLAQKATDAISALMKSGLSLGDATRAYWNLKAHIMKAESQ